MQPTDTQPASAQPEHAQIVLDQEAIKAVIPHREPFLLVDRVIITEQQRSAIGYKDVTGKEDFFRGHFPGNPIMPGVLVVEAMAQTACVLYLSRPDLAGKFAYFMKIDNTKFRKPVLPGDVLELRVEVLKARERAGAVRGVAYVNGAVVVESDFMFALVDRRDDKQSVPQPLFVEKQLGRNIHPTAVIHPSAQLHPSCTVGPYTIIGEDVILDEGVQVGGHCTIECAHVKRNTRIHNSVNIGTLPQDIRYRGERTRVVIGENCTIREFVSIHRGTSGKETLVGNNCYIMAYSHIAHDCSVGNDVTMANCATLAGHVSVEEGVNIGGLVAVHQHVKIGRLAMLGGGAMVSKDVPPFVMVVGDRAELRGINIVGMRRRGLSRDVIKEIKLTYKRLFRSKLPLSEALARIEAEKQHLPEIRYMLDFIKSSKRGICRMARARYRV